MTFRVGQRVCCVEGTLGSSYLVKGRIYTVLADPCPLFPGLPDKRIIQVDAPGMLNADGTTCYSWFAHRFRPIVSRQTDISALQALLVPGAKIREEA